MATPIIRSTGSSSGTITGHGRKDLIIGETVTLTDAETANVGATYIWTLLDTPVTSTASLSGASTPTATFSPDVTGSYRVHCLVNGISSSEEIIAVALSYTNARIPAYNELTQYDGDGNTKGWHTDQTLFMRQTDAALSSVTVGTNKVKVSSGDTTTNYLVNKVLEGTGITVTKENAGANEDLKIASKGLATVSSGDTTPGYLLGKLVAGTNVTLTKGNAGADETLTIASTAVGGLVKVDVSDTTASYLASKLLAGQSISLTVGTPGGNETLTAAFTGDIPVSSGDTTPAHLATKLVAGTNVSITKNNPGGNETLTIASTASGIGASTNKLITPILCGINKSYYSDTHLIIGVVEVNPNDFTVAGTTMSAVFRATGLMGNSGITGNVRLVNVSDSETVATLTFNSTTLSVQSSTLTIGSSSGNLKNSSKFYEVHIWVNSPASSLDSIELGVAEIRIINTVN